MAEHTITTTGKVSRRAVRVGDDLLAGSDGRHVCPKVLRDPLRGDQVSHLAAPYATGPDRPVIFIRLVPFRPGGSKQRAVLGFRRLDPLAPNLRPSPLAVS